MAVVELPGRGKGSHRIYSVQSSEGIEVSRFGLTDHPRELTWTVLRGVETALAPWFGDKWMEADR
ncbi:hypothetical protein [Pseudonocardia sp. TRM90224]|uniref:hypothetical protein n=1 Tax=Pseudonocardia sp. TRM90224 TaxID=2812678 RepID=UPI001E4FEFF4|nr:hypothetical protein [Pseudonocardia sp. TRM90224]